MNNYVAGYINTTSAINGFNLHVIRQHRFWHNKTIWNRRLMSLIKLNNRAVKDVTQFGSITSLGSLTHISTATASASASIEFTSGIDSTYKEYVFYFVNIHPATDTAAFNSMLVQMVEVIIMLLKLQLGLEHIITKQVA
jgi:hypothetical protein